MDLFIIDLQYPRDDEKVLVKLCVSRRHLMSFQDLKGPAADLAHRQAQDVHTERMHITDADIMILQKAKTERFRLVVRSKTGYSVLSQERT